MADKFVTLNIFDSKGDFVNTMELNVESYNMFTAVVEGLGGRVQTVASFETLDRIMEEEA